MHQIKLYHIIQTTKPTESTDRKTETEARDRETRNFKQDRVKTHMQKSSQYVTDYVVPKLLHYYISTVVKKFL